MDGALFEGNSGAKEGGRIVVEDCSSPANPFLRHAEPLKDLQQLTVIDGVKGLADIKGGGEERSIGAAVGIGEKVEEEALLVGAAAWDETPLLEAELDELAGLALVRLEEETGDGGVDGDRTGIRAVGAGSGGLGKEGSTPSLKDCGEAGQGGVE